MNYIEYKEVDKSEFDSFIKSYPNKLVRDVYGAFEPPLITFNDFLLGDWPDSVIAYYKDCKASIFPDEPIEYFVMLENKQ